MDHPTQPVPVQTINLTSVQSALMHLHEITDAGDGQQANAFMRAIINNLWTSIGFAPNPILSARYPTKLVGQHLLCWIKEFLTYNMNPNWFGWMTPFMCTEYTRICDINNYRKMQAFEWVYEAEAGELGPEGVYSAVLMPVLKVTSNGSIVSNWEVCPNGGMADKWESDNEGEEEGVSAADLQTAQVASRVVAGACLVGDCNDLHVVAGSLCQADLPQHVVEPSSSGIGDCHQIQKRKPHWGLVRKKIVAGLVFKAGLRHLGICCNGEPVRRNVARSEESILLSREVADDDVGMFQEHFEESSRWKYRNFSSDTCEGIDKTARLSKVTGMDASILQRQRTTIFRQIHPFIRQFCHPSIRENAVCSPSFRRDLSNLVGKFWLATSDPMSSDVDTGPSDEDGHDDKDMGYGVGMDGMDVDAPVPEGEPSRDKIGEEWRVASETRADSAGTQAAATLAGLVAYGASSDDGSGEEEEGEEEKAKANEEEVEVKKNAATGGEDERTSDTDDEREEEEEEEDVDQLNSGEEEDSAPKTKGDVLLFTPHAHC
ncbi:hypothetical protein ARMGADRAFT_1022901 [Armillaria gallica]|uniref:Uncharacterized protein n=1 Tax=Armillaria gallica TaxID=47427 RepID=A0A2H3EYX4_ARMGA|nr:hypothetical protein ARMGADRAFT_1022901 [Armillaria gallica]